MAGKQEVDSEEERSWKARVDMCRRAEERNESSSIGSRGWSRRKKPDREAQSRIALRSDALQELVRNEVGKRRGWSSVKKMEQKGWASLTLLK